MLLKRFRGTFAQWRRQLQFRAYPSDLKAERERQCGKSGGLSTDGCSGTYISDPIGTINSLSRSMNLTVGSWCEPVSGPVRSMLSSKEIMKKLMGMIFMSALAAVTMAWVFSLGWLILTVL